jgi:hypothetical protein
MTTDNFDNQPKPEIGDETLADRQVQIEQKTFHLSLKENRRGRFVRISEEIANHRNSVIIPANGLGEFKQALEDLIQESGGLPPAGTTGA